MDSIQRMPDTANLDDIAERVRFLLQIREGLDAVERGATIPNEEVKRQLATWLNKMIQLPRRIVATALSLSAIGAVYL